MSLPAGYIKKIRTSMHAYAAKRRDVINQAGDALHHAKRAIFAMHRDNMNEAEEKLRAVEKALKGLRKKYAKEPKLFEEGSYKAAVEEYVEATLFYQFLTKGKLSEITSIPLSPDSYIAGLCDLPGELYRYAIKAATNRDIAMVKKCARMSDDITGGLIEFNLTSYLRNKFDQAKQANGKIERIVYEVSLLEK